MKFNDAVKCWLAGATVIFIFNAIVDGVFRNYSPCSSTCYICAPFNASYPILVVIVVFVPLYYYMKERWNL
jgi:hypothetical protein